MSKIAHTLPSKEEMLLIFVDKLLIPDDLIVPYYRLAKDIAGDSLKENSIFFISVHKELLSFKEIYTQLPVNQRYTIIEYYGLLGKEPKTLNEIGHLLNLSGSRIGQLREKALLALRKSKIFERCTVKYLETLSIYFEELSNYYNIEYYKYKGQVIEKQTLETDIDYLNLPVRTNNALRRYGYNTIDAVRRMSKDELLCIRNIGPKARNEIWQKLHGKNFE